MKKMIKRIFGIICSFILGVQSRIFAIDQTDVNGLTPETKNGGKLADMLNDGKLINMLNSEDIARQPSLYGPPPETITKGEVFSIVASILLFIIGLIVILNKNIKKKVKVITIIVLLTIIIALFLLMKYSHNIVIV